MVWEAAAITKALADLYFPPLSVRSRDLVRGYIQSSRSRQVFFDALYLICEELYNRGEAVTGLLAKWRQEVAGGLRRRPAIKPIPPHRPADPAQLEGDIPMQFTIAVLERDGVPPQGNPVSGCRIVAEAFGLPDDTVVRIWKECTWRKSFLPAMRKYSKAIAKRTGLLPPQ